MRTYKSLTIIVCLVGSVIAVPEGISQTRPFEVGVSVGAAVPTTNFRHIAGPGFFGGVHAGRWSSEHVFLFLATGYDSFGEHTFEDGSKETGAFLPVELGFRFHPSGADLKGIYLSVAGGVLFSQGDFEGRKAGMTLGVGYTFPARAKQLSLDVRYRSEVSDPFNSYLNLGITVGFGAGGK